MKGYIIKSSIRCKVVVRAIGDYVYKHINTCPELIPQYVFYCFVHILLFWVGASVVFE